MSKEYAEKRNKKVKTVQPTTVEKIDETKTAKQDYAQTVAEKKNLAPKATVNTTTDNAAKSADSSIKATSITAPKSNKAVKASTSIPTVKATNYDKSALVNEARNYNAQKRFVEKGYASEWEPKTQEIPTLKPALTDAQVISQYEEIPEYNVFQRMFNKDNREAYNKKQELSQQYRVAKDNSIPELLNKYGMTSDDLYTIGLMADLSNSPNKYFRDEMSKYGASDIDTKYLQDYIARQSQEELNEKIQKAVETNTATKALGWAGARVLNPIEAVTNLTKRGVDYLGGKPLTKNVNYSQNTTNTASENLSGLGKNIYDAGTSYADMIIASLLTGGNNTAASLLLGAEKADSTMDSAIERGLTPRQIMGESLASGATTYATEKLLGLTKIDKLAKESLDGFKGTKLALEVAKRIAFSFIGEGSQEFLEGVADRIVDDWVAKDKSSVNREIARMVSEGVPEEEARKTANKEWLLQTAIEGVIGGIGGAMFGGTDIAISNIPFLNRNRINGDTNAEIPAVNQTENVAEEIQNNVPTVEEIAEEISNNPEMTGEPIVENAIPTPAENQPGLTGENLADLSLSEITEGDVNNVENLQTEQPINDVASVMNDYINSQQGNNVDTIPYPNDSRYVSEDVTAEDLRNGENLNDIRERGYNETLIEKTDAPEELKAEVANNPMLYRVLHNPDVLAQVNEIVSNNSLDDAYKICNEMMGTKNPVALPLAYNLSKQFVQKGDVNTAVTLTEDAGRALTEAGQFIQATTISMLNNDPMASMVYLQRAIGRMNQEGAKKFKRKWKDFELTESEVEAFGNIEEGDVDAINDLYAQIWTRIGKTYPVKWWDKMLEMRRVFLLCNMRTTVRNGVSNTAMLPLRWTGGRVTALLESIYQRVNSEYVRTEAKGSISKEAKRVANEACDAYFKVLFDETDAKYTEARSAIRNAQVFKGGKLDATIDKGATWIANHGIRATKSMLTAIDKTTGGAVSKFMDISGIKNIDSLMNVINNKTAHHDINPSLLETIRNFTYWTLGEFGDTPFVKINFKQKLASYCEANGITKVEDIPQDAIALCVQEANKATFHDNSKVAQAMESLRETFNKFVPGAKLGDLIVTFAKAPGNIAARAVDYSPIGATKGAIDTVKGTANIKNLNKQIAQAQETVNTSESKAEIKKAQDAIAKYNNEKAQTMYQIQQALTLMGQGLTGTALFALGKALSRMGFVIGSLSDDKREKQYQQDVLGKQNNSVEIGDLSYSIDFLQPAALPILFGVIYEESFNQQSENFLTSLKQALVSVGDAWLDSTPMKNVSDMLGGYGTPTENIIDTILQIPSSWVPSQVNAITQIGDRTERISYDKSSVGNTIKNSIIAKLPGASETLPAKYDLWGREKVRQDTAGQAAFAKLVNPGTTKSTHPTEIDKDILSLYDKTKNVKVLPRFAENSYKVGDENYQLTNQQKSDFQRVMGENSYKLAEKYVKSDSWKNSNDTAKALALDSMYEFASNLAKREVLGATPSSAEKLLELYDKEGIDAVFNKLANDAQYKGYADELGVDSSKAKEIYENVGEEGMQKYARAVNEAQKFGADSIRTDEWNAFNSGNLGEFNNMVRTRVALENSNVPSTEATQKYIEQHGANAIPQLEEAYNIVSTIPKGKDEYGNQQYFNLTSDMLDIYDKDGAKGLQNYKDALSIAQTKYGADNITTSEYKDYNNGFMDDFNDSVKYRTLLENNDLKDTELNRNYVKEYGESIIPVLQDAEEAITQIQKGVDKYNDAKYFSPNKKMIDVYMDKGKNGVELYADLYTRDDIDDDPNTRHLTDTIPYLYSMDMSDAEKGYYLSKFVSGKTVNSYIDREQPDYAGLYNYYIHNDKYVPAIRAYANH